MSEQIQAKFFRAAKKPGVKMIQVCIPNSGREKTWVDCTEQVHGFAQVPDNKTGNPLFQEGDAVILTADMVDGKYNVTRIEKAQQQTQTPPAQASSAQQSSAKPVQTTPPPLNTGSIAPPKQYMNPKTPKESAQIMRLSVYASACEAVKALTGQTDINTIPDFIETIYKRGIALVQPT